MSAQMHNFIQNDQQYNLQRQLIQDYVNHKKKLYNAILNFLENSDSDDFGDFKENLKEIKGNQEEIYQIMEIINKISNNHHRSSNFINKIKEIIQYLKDQIKQTMSNNDIFKIFKSNKAILLFLFENEILIFTDQICIEIFNREEFIKANYCQFFYPEIKSFIDDERIKKIENDIKNECSQNFDKFNEIRQKGVNNSYICSLIIKDSVEEFIAYVNKKNIPLNSEIKTSIFETNSFLIKHKTSLIEYSAFYGSIQIFQYLQSNNVNLESSLWLYAIHSQNAELINILESNNIQPPNNEYENCLIESIKCHHNEIASYIQNNFLPMKKNEEIVSSIFHFYNYEYFPDVIENEDEFFYLCCYNYETLVNLYMKMKEEFFIKTIILNKLKFFLSNLKKKNSI